MRHDILLTEDISRRTNDATDEDLYDSHSKNMASGNTEKIKESSYKMIDIDAEIAYYGFEKIGDSEGLSKSRPKFIRRNPIVAYYAFRRVQDEEGLEAVRQVMVDRNLEEAQKHFLNCFDIEGLRKVSRKIVLDYYSKRIEEYDAKTEGPFAVGWGSRKISVEEARKRMRTRFEELTRGLDFADSSVMDVGCGLADLYGFLSGKGLIFDYTGIDINPEMVEHAQRLRPGINVVAGDFLEDDWGQFDYVVSSGIFCLKTPTYIRDMEEILRKQFELSRIATAASFMDKTKVDYMEPDLNYVDPKEVEEFLKSCGASRVEIRRDYPLFEFTVVVWR